MNRRAKQGNVFIFVGIVVLMIILFVTFIVYYQVNIIAESIRKDLFYASKDAILAFNIQELSYGKYMVDTNKSKEVIEYILNKNYVSDNSSVTKIKIMDIKINTTTSDVVIKVEIKVKFKSIINISGEYEHEFKMKENIKISLMNYRGNI